jgi:two-component system NarL family response regulator
MRALEEVRRPVSVRRRLANIYRSIQTPDATGEADATPLPGSAPAPFGVEPAPTSAEGSSAAGRSVEVAHSMPTNRPPGSRVMIVDDHALVREAVGRALNGSGIDIVAEAGSAEEALERAAEARPDLILLDIDLPATNGLDAIVELRRRAPNARIVMLTISNDDEDVAEAIRLGASGFLTKDMSSDALLRAVSGALKGDLAMPRGMAQRLIDRLGGSPAVSREPLTAERLTSRELEILRLLSDGMTAREIGDALVLSPRTVEGHVGKILRKLGARNRVEAVQHYRHRPAG